jgi:hypothetical protein
MDAILQKPTPSDMSTGRYNAICYIINIAIDVKRLPIGSSHYWRVMLPSPLSAATL